jgi:hypothetical protein
MTTSVNEHETCRERRRQLGLSYPKSNCDECGSILSPGWICARQDTAAVSPLPVNSPQQMTDVVPLYLVGVGRHETNDRGMILYFNRSSTENELREVFVYLLEKFNNGVVILREK